jgi:hypothetical protein
MANKYKKKMFKIFRHQGNLNQNCIEILPHPSHRNYNKKQQEVLAMTQEKKDPTTGRNVNQCIHLGNQHGGLQKYKDGTVVIQLSPSWIYPQRNVSQHTIQTPAHLG